VDEQDRIIFLFSGIVDVNRIFYIENTPNTLLPLFDTDFHFVGAPTALNTRDSNFIVFSVQKYVRMA